MDIKKRERRQEIAKSLLGRNLKDLSQKEREEIKKAWVNDCDVTVRYVRLSQVVNQIIDNLRLKGESNG